MRNLTTCSSLVLLAIVVLVVSDQAKADPDPIQELAINIQKACPKQWEDIYSNIRLNPNVLDVWQGDITDKAQFIQYASEVDADGNARLLDENGNLLIDSYNDAITVMAECSAQRVTYYKAIRADVVNTIGGMVSELTSRTAFSQTSIADGVDYQSWIDGTKTISEDPAKPAVNLAIGSATTQSGTSSDELSDTETELTEDEYADLAEGQGYANNAVDNNLDGNFVNGSVTHTGIQDQPYWEVDLEKMNELTEIVIYNRTDCCASRLNNFSVLLASRPIDARKLEDARQLEGVHEVFSGLSHTTFSPAATESVESKKVVSYKRLELPEGTKARYVRIQLAGNKTTLSLAEVQIMGTGVVDEELHQALEHYKEAPPE